MFQHAVRTRPLSSWSTRSQGDSTNSSDSEMTCWWALMGQQKPMNKSCTRVIKLPILGESNQYKCIGNFELFAHNALFELLMWWPLLLMMGWKNPLNDGIKYLCSTSNQCLISSYSDVFQWMWTCLVWFFSLIFMWSTCGGTGIHLIYLKSRHLKDPLIISFLDKPFPV